MQNHDEILDDEALAERWKVKGSPQAIKKKFQRLRLLEEKHARHLKSFPVGGSPRYRMSDILEYEARARHFISSLAEFSGDDSQKALDEWIELAGLAGFDKE